MKPKPTPYTGPRSVAIYWIGYEHPYDDEPGALRMHAGTYRETATRFAYVSGDKASSLTNRILKTEDGHPVYGHLSAADAVEDAAASMRDHADYLQRGLLRTLCALRDLKALAEAEGLAVPAAQPTDLHVSIDVPATGYGPPRPTPTPPEDPS